MFSLRVLPHRIKIRLIREREANNLAWPSFGSRPVGPFLDKNTHWTLECERRGTLFNFNEAHIFFASK